MKIGIELHEATNGNFSGINLSFTDLDKKEHKVPLILRSFVNIYDLKKASKSIEFDLFLISTLVYGVDNLIDREFYSVDGWARELEVDFPVYNIKEWKGQEKVLEDALKFLTGDYWKINFIENKIKNYFKETKRRWNVNKRSFDVGKIKTTSLFSGGLDSLIGVIDELEKLSVDEEILLVSHFDFKSPGPNQDQNSLFTKLKAKYPKKIKDNWIQIKLALNRHDINEEELKLESNYRSRSFFFIGLGCLVSPSSNLIIPENGTISINYPLTPSRVSSLSTRTTHPFVIGKLQELLNNLNINIKLDNPYKFDTKGDMVINCSNKSLLKEILELSTSCGKPGRKQNWKNKNTKHCGTCMPCVYRRASLNKAGEDNQVYGNDITSPLSRDSFVDLPAVINFLTKNISVEKMKQDILINGSVPMSDLDKYATLVLNSKKEVLSLFKSKGNQFIKDELEI
ncbi:Qat anti-phage system QueC-like protein QatC [Tenacibaculum larymnensis]|uniref:7-cyano-7-deazaguanine synthase n=1 Tax=Tenacibaculum larymnensis TaxID=2878201 RepID=A0A9X4EL78_9FLAO|nr:Qat anti-phage system QueC-like protein QatC [Tenacibaculum larymnensis]MDE1206016.1 hypothetical protein [Tenacibaculum larymnensis]